jgi:predicted patatin/cPLA2 family phospholipase
MRVTNEIRMMEGVGLILEGGGLRGQYTAGVLDAFLEASVGFPYLIGVSAGASIACSFVSRQHGRNRLIVERYRNDPRYFSWAGLLTRGSAFGMDFIFDEIPHRLVPFDFEAFHSSPTRFVTVCTDCETGEACYFDKEGEDHLTLLRASASLPFMSPMVRYRGHLLLDGAIADALPLGRALGDGFLKNVVVLTRAPGYRKKPSSRLPAVIIYGRKPRLALAINARWRRYNESLEAIEAAADAGEILLIRPRGDPGISRTEGSVRKLNELYELGRSDGAAAVPAARRLAGLPS